MSKNNFIKCLSKLTPDELAAYIIETGRSNGVINLRVIITSCELACDNASILSRSFSFKNSVAGPDYWAKVFKRLHDEDVKDIK